MIDRLTWKNGLLDTLEFRFAQYCDGAKAALHGKIRWLSNPDNLPDTGNNRPGSVPSDLWAPPAGRMPVSGNYLYLESASGDYIGAGKAYLYTDKDSQIAPAINGALLHLNLKGSQTWSADFQGMNSLSSLLPGYYASLQRYPFHDPTKGGLNWEGEGRACNRLQGWFVIDSIQLSNGVLQAIDLRFEQRCDGATVALHGKLHWSRSGAFSNGPLLPIPASLWKPAVALPAGNAIYLQSDSGDLLGQGKSYLYGESAQPVLLADKGLLRISVGDWNGILQTMQTITELKPGYYTDLQRQGYHDPAKGGFVWSSKALTCDTSSSWVAIDKVSYVDGVLDAIDLRFEQHCGSSTSSLHGAVHWVQPRN